MDPIRALSIALATLVVGAVLLVALGPGTRPPPDDTLVVALESTPQSLDPHVGTASSDFRVANQLFEGLVRFSPGSLELEPSLAERWSISEDGTRYVFELREGVSFHDGSALDAEAVRFNFERMLDAEHPFHHTGPFPLSFFFEAVEGVRVLGPLTVELSLSRPFAPLLANLAYPTGLIVSPASVRRHGAAVGRHPSGTGPFLLEAYERDRLVLGRNEAYWAAPPRINRVVFRPLTDEMTRVAELRAGGLDLLLDLSADNLRWFRGEEGFEVHEREGAHLWFLIFNTREPPFSDVRVRRAANLAVDKEALVAGVLQGTAEVASGPIPRAFTRAHPAEVGPYPHDPQRARALLAEAGHPRGVDVTFLVPQGGTGMLSPLQMATAIQADLAAVGIRARIETFEWNSYLAQVNPGLAGKAHLAAMAWMTHDPDTLPYLTLRSDAAPPAGFNSGYYENPEVDRLLERARTRTRESERAALYRRVHRLVHDDAPWLFVASWKQTAVSRGPVRDFSLEPSWLLSLQRTWKR